MESVVKDQLASKTTDELRALGRTMPELRPQIVAILRQRESVKIAAITNRLAR